MEARFPPAKMSENDGVEPMSAADCNLSSLCEHIQGEGFNAGAFSDVVVQAMGSTHRLHRLILSRSPYFRNMLHGPWKEAGLPVLTLHIDDKNVNTEAIAMALAYLYGHHPKLNDENAFRILAAASFLDLQDLCRICTDYIISELWTSNFLAYQVFAESQDYGRHGERVRNACWGYLCQSGAMELKEVLPKLSSQTLLALLTSDELWVPSEEKRFELALYTLLAKGSLSRTDETEESSSASEVGVPDSKEEQMHQVLNPVPALENVRSCSVGQSSSSGTSFSEMNETKSSYSYVEVETAGATRSHEVNRIMAMEGPSEGDSYHLSMNTWLASDQSRPDASIDPLNDRVVLNDWGRCGMPSLSWGGRTVGRRQVKGYAKGNCGIHRDYYDTFINIFEGGSLLYCNMSFEELLNVRKQLEELGFPGKAVNDGLWLQMLLSQSVLEIGADTCNACCFTSMECTCRQPFGYSQGTNYYVQENEHYSSPGTNGNVYDADAAQGQRNELFRPVRVHVRGQVDGLAGIGRGPAFVPADAWPPTRFVFSRVPFGMGNRTGQQSVCNDDSEKRTEHSGDLTGDGLTALVGLSRGGNNTTSIHAEQVERVYETDSQGKLSGASFAMPTSGGITVQMVESQDCPVGIGWEGTDSSSISLDMKTPLSHFPPFRFGVEFAEVHRLGDGQVKHSPDFFYAGSLWKVSVQAFNDEDPQGRRTLGLFLHRRKAEPTDSLRKVHMFVDSREKVKARYQLICPSKREVLVFGSFKQRGTLLPKAPKGWGWRSALLFDELPELLQCGTLRIAAIVQLV